ncbi:Phosphatidylinositol 3-kinase catalytic subunit type 3 [Myotis brandtii]|uniref:Phosphatidylinositol 3-kinase catalytic subunit type 3 n=2 Tax=Boreoeutheria TaxID=1437010 RepID=S7PXZ3_MYOBR|nr:Phosphatidylinositol 3-kinase catalytic subunit type 3 [Myotis brandtii]
MGEAEKFHYIYSCDLDINVRLKIGSLEGKREQKSYKAVLEDPMLKFSGLYQETCSDLYVTCQVFAEGKPLALPVRTSYKAFSTRWNWNEWLKLPVKYPDLPRNAQVALTIWDVYGPGKAVPVGGTTVSLFGKYGMFRQGMHDLKVWPNVEADGSEPTKTPGRTSSTLSEDQMSRLAKLTKAHRQGHMVKVDWLDRLTFREIEMINESEKRSSNFMYLMVEFRCVKCDDKEYGIVYYEKDGDESSPILTSFEIVKVPDPQMSMENLVESKHHKLARSLRSGPSDHDLKPNATTRDQLNIIVSYPPTKQLTYEEQDLVWKFRCYLTNQEKALTKFLKCVNWDLPQEAKQALELLGKWKPMDVEDSLELLSSHYTNPTVRRYAVARLRQADDEDLLMYLLQLVQALKYENFDDIKNGLEPTKKDGQGSVSESTSSSGINSAEIDSSQIITSPVPPVSSPPPASKTKEGSDGENLEQDLCTFLISRACKNSTLANYLYWYVIVECEDQDTQQRDPKTHEMYLNVMRRFSQALLKGDKSVRVMRSLLAAQQTFVDRLVHLMKAVQRESGNRKKKNERLQALLGDNEKMNLSDVELIPLPLEPQVKIRGIIPETATLFKSALMPAQLFFKTEDGGKYPVIFKHGDDLRQDQLILQIISLMDKLLRKENLDLKLTPYKVLATSTKHGFMQFIQSVPVAEVLDTEGSIQNFFRKYAPSDNGPYGISAEVMDTYVKSCAGYCVITYILGVGDRHLDNLLLTKTGKLFHIDFGYILGRDPKPLPPPMKLNKEMVEGMGGTQSEQYQEFRKQCYTAFLHLRRYSNLILNLFSLMVDANIPDIALEPDKTVKKVQDKFRLDLSDEEAVHYMQSLIDESVHALFAAVVEQIHKFAQVAGKRSPPTAQVPWEVGHCHPPPVPRPSPGPGPDQAIRAYWLLVAVCGVVDLVQGPTQFPQRLGAGEQPRPPPLLLVAICGVIGRTIRPPLAPALTWCHPLTCSTIPPWSCSPRGPLEPAVPPLLPAASTTSLTLTWPTPPPSGQHAS